MLVTLAVVAFMGLDLAAVIGALLWLSDQRAQQARRAPRQPERRI